MGQYETDIIEWKAEAKARAAGFLHMKHSLHGRDRRELKEEQKSAINEWRSSLRSIDRKERKAQKKAFKAYKKRLKRFPRMVALSLAAVLLASGAVAAAPVVSVFKSMYASQNYVLSGPAVDAAREAGRRISAEICDEGFVLLKNENGMLPLRNDIKLNVFGDDAYNFVFGASGTAGAEQNGAVGIFEAMDQAGISYNHDIDSIYRKAGLK